MFALLDEFGIAHETWQHPAIFTVEEGESLGLHHHIPGQGGKSLLLKNKTGGLWLVVACENTKVDLKGLSDNLGTKRFSFASPETMVETMQVTPGSATPFALMHDKDHKIQVIIDEKFFNHTHCVFHPLENKWSTVITPGDLLGFLTRLGYMPRTMQLEVPAVPSK